VGGGNADPRYYIDTVVQGKDDYYSDRGETPGTWHGAGAEDRGLDGSVSSDEFMNVLVEPMAKAKTVLAYDLTFSAPKSVSVLYGVGDREVSPVVRDAHDAAVRSALDYLERQATWTRRGEGGRQVLRGEGLTVAMFRHRTSRAGDPQLHTHSVVANTTRAEGRDTALDGRVLYAHGRTVAFRYQAELRKNLTETLGVEWEPVQRGVAEISGVSGDVMLHFSRRSVEIREQLAAGHARLVAAVRASCVNAADVGSVSSGCVDVKRGAAPPRGTRTGCRRSRACTGPDRAAPEGS
jgi:conjugative relaxase-like TrwC/TraI family protein